MWKPGFKHRPVWTQSLYFQVSDVIEVELTLIFNKSTEVRQFSDVVKIT